MAVLLTLVMSYTINILIKRSALVAFDYFNQLESRCTE